MVNVYFFNSVLYSISSDQNGLDEMKKSGVPKRLKKDERGIRRKSAIEKRLFGKNIKSYI